MAKQAGISSDSVKAKTGKHWEEWFQILDKAGAKKLDHKSIARYLYEIQGVPGWWSQMVTVGYEQARGLREVHQQADGFSANASKTYPVGVDQLFSAFAEARRRQKWLGPAPLEVRTKSPGKSIRFTWSEGNAQSSVDVYFTSKGGSKSSAAVQHNKLVDASAVSRSKEFWKAALSRLGEQVSPR